MSGEREGIDVAVVGGGIIGLGVAWRLIRRGHRVALYERGRAGQGATWAAAGMLAAAAEIGFEHLDLYHLARESLRRWPGFARALEKETGRTLGYDATGTLVVAVDRDDVERLRRLHRFQREHDVPVEWLAGHEALEREPLLSPRLPAALFAPDDHQVDHRAVVQALAEAVRAGGRFHEHTSVRAVEPHREAPVLILDDGSRIEARAVVLAAGAWAREVGGLTPRPPVRPVKGQALALAGTEAFALRHIVRGPGAYLVPKASGRIIIGATSEEMGFDTTVTAGGLYRLLDGAVEVVPGVEELAVVETWAGLRPASRDHAPLLGPGAPGVVFALGHYRHGVLLAAVTAEEVAAEIDARLRGTAEASAWLAPFSPSRFSKP